ncbi:MAG: ATP synthase F1 subunit delta [Planctomycetes bacterium]|nr:ATP synthase F1 subunit delta [Planctomycetota bacterium]
MKEPNAPPRYGEALLDVAEKQRAVPEVIESARLVAEVSRVQPRILAFLSVPQVTRVRKKEMLHRVFEARIHPVLLDFLCLLVDRQRTDSLLEIFNAFEDLWDRRRGIHPVEVRTAVPLAEDLKARMIEKLEVLCGGRVRIHWVVDSSLIGGVVVLVGDTGTDIDGSLRRQIGQLREKLLQVKVY